MKILVAYDGSKISKNALYQGASLANITESEITILSVIPIINIPVLEEQIEEKSISSKETTNFQQQTKQYYSKSLKNTGNEIQKKYPELKVNSILIDGKPSKTILEIAEKGDYDLIIIGSRGLGGITGWILGSTSRRVVESCKIPILVVK
jgi:nucleotide-binding universal stress UspA family protein